MKKMIIVVSLLAFAMGCAPKSSSITPMEGGEGKAAGVSVTKENYAFAMFDMAMQREFALGADNTWHHHRKPMPLDEQPAPMMNRDTLYSFAILDARGDIAVTIPESNGRYISLHVVNHDHVTYRVFYGAGRHLIPASETSDFIVANVRTQVGIDDVAAVNALQDQFNIEHLNGYQPASFQVTNWNMDEFNALHAVYVEVAKKEGVSGSMGTVASPVSLEDRNRGVSIATGLLPDADAVYLTSQYTREEGKSYKATYAIPDMVDPDLGFYSITIYGDDQYLHTDQGSTINNSTIKKNPDGKSFDVYYVGEDAFGAQPNSLIMPTDTFWINMRIYMPGDSVKNGDYKLPELQGM